MFIGIRPKEWRKKVFKLKSKYIRKNRLYQISKPLLGLTGGIATGKSTVTSKLTAMGFPVIEADKLVHQIYAKESSLEFIKENYPSTVIKDKIDFPSLRKVFFENLGAKKEIENFIYSQLENEFLEKAKEFGQYDFLIYDVPLLFEKELNLLVDQSICVYTDQKNQISRMMKRDNIDVDLAKKMIQAQIDIEKKKEISDFVIENISTLEKLDMEIERFIRHYFTT